MGRSAMMASDARGWAAFTLATDPSEDAPPIDHPRTVIPERLEWLVWSEKIDNEHNLRAGGIAMGRVSPLISVLGASLQIGIHASLDRLKRHDDLRVRNPRESRHLDAVHACRLIEHVERS